MRLYKKNDFAQGLIWNYVSIFFLAIGGVTFSFLIGYYYDAKTLGEFNLVYACYIVLSQVGVWGSHMAVTKYVSEYAESKEITDKILSSALLDVLIISVIAGGVIGIICNVILNGFFSDALLGQINSILIAVVFFSINKVILGYLNGKSRMKEYAVFQALRNILIASYIILFAILDISGSKICYCFAYTEIVLFILAIFFVFIRGQVRLSINKEWAKKIIIFGTDIMPANIVLELSTKVDIFCLWLVLRDDEIIGIYSFAALFAEGFYQLFVVIRRSINPIITQSFIKLELEKYYHQVIEQIKKWGYLAGGLCAFLVMIAHKVLCVFMKDESFFEGSIALFIIMIAIVINMRSIIFGNILSQTGYPVAESINNIITVVSNFILNILFIFCWGMIGAALATGTSYFLFSINQKMMMKKKLNILN